MCGAKPNVDTTIQDQMLEESRLARQREEERQQRITDGTAAINGKFAGFDQSFYDGIRDTGMNYYQPQLDTQFNQARDNTTFALARAGTLNSSIAGKAQADLTTRYNDTLASLLSQSQAAADSQRQRVEGEKSSLISLLTSTADADMASNEALARTQMLYQERPSYNPIGDVFGGLSSGIGQYLYNRNQQSLYDNYMRSAGGNGSSSRVVG